MFFALTEADLQLRNPAIIEVKFIGTNDIPARSVAPINLAISRWFSKSFRGRAGS